jgi:hypothetical protein
MNSKEDLLIKLLTKLLPYRDLAEGILALVESSYADEKMVDGLLLLISQSIKNVKNTEAKAKLEKGLEAIQKIKHEEAMDQEEAEKLLDTI